VPNKNVKSKKSKKTNPKKDHPYVQVRLKPGEKQEWIDFVNNHNEFTYLSELVRYCVREYIEKGEKEESNENLKPVITDLINVLGEERKEYLDKIDQVLESNRKAKGIKTERKHKELGEFFFYFVNPFLNFLAHSQFFKFAKVKKFCHFSILVGTQGQRTITHIIEYRLGESKRK
jgi:hypothetical protein